MKTELLEFETNEGPCHFRSYPVTPRSPLQAITDFTSGLAGDMDSTGSNQTTRLPFDDRELKSVGVIRCDSFKKRPRRGRIARPPIHIASDFLIRSEGVYGLKIVKPKLSQGATTRFYYLRSFKSHRIGRRVALRGYYFWM